MAYDKLNPPDDPYWRTGLLASMMECLWGGKRKKLDPDKYMPSKRLLIQSAKQQKANLMAFTERYNSKRNSST